MVFDPVPSYKFKITANVVSGAWVANGTRDEAFNSNSSSNSTGSGNSTSAESVEANNSVNVVRGWSHNSTENSSTSGFANSSWLNGGWSLIGGSANSSGNGSSHLSSNGTTNYNRTFDGGTLSGNLTVHSSNGSKWDSKSKGDVANGGWVYSGNASDSANTTNNRTLNGSGHYSFNNDTFKQNGTVTEFTFDSDSSDTSSASNQTADGSWVQVGGDSLAKSDGISQLTYTNSAVVQNANVTVRGSTFTGNRTDSMVFGTDYSSKVSSRFGNGSWSAPNGTGNTSEFIIIRSKVSGEFSDGVTAHNASISGTTTFDHTGSYKDSIVRHYALDANGSWARAGNNTYHGALDVVFDRQFVQSNVPYTRTPCVTEISGIGTITGDISVSSHRTITFHGDLTYDTTGSGRSVANGSAYYTDTNEYHSGYSGNGTWTRTRANGLTLTGNMSESGNNDSKVSYRFDYKYESGNWLQSDTWKLTGGSANATSSSTDLFASDASHTSVVVVDSTEPSYQGVAVYYVGFNLDGSQSGGFTSVGDSSSSLTTISRHSTTTVTEFESFHRQASTRLTQDGKMLKNANGAWAWCVSGNGTSTTSGDWLVGTITGFIGTATTVWNKNGTSLTATSSLQSTTTEITGGGWRANNSFEFIDGNWTQTGTNLTKTVVYDRTLQASGTSGLTTVGGCLSLSMSASRTDNSTLGAYYNHTISGSGDVTVWGHNGTNTVVWSTSANLTSGSGCSTSSEYFRSNFSESLTTNSTWSQTGGGPAIGANMAIYSRNSVYSGGSGGGYGGYGGSSSYSGGQNWTWSDPNLSTYDAHALSEIRITPNGPAEIGPITFRSAPNVAFVMPPALVEDTEAAAAGQEQTWSEWAVDQGIGFIPVIGSARDAYRAYMEGDNLSLVLNVGMLGVDLWTLGGASLAKGVVKSSLRAEKSLMKVSGKALASKGDDFAKLYNRCDNVGKNMLVNNAGTARQFSDDTLKVCTDKINCFARDTVVSTPTGPRPIGGIQPGERVLAFDFETGEWVSREVLERHDSNYYGPLVTITTDGGPIRTTVYHPFWVVQGFDLEERDTPRELAEDEDQGLTLDGRWVNSHEVRAGDVIIGRDGRELRVKRVEQEYVESFPVSNLTIEEHHTFAVGTDAVLVHNQSVCPVHIDIGGEGRYPKAINVNPGPHQTTTGVWGNPIPNQVKAKGQLLPFSDNSIHAISLENAPITTAIAKEIKRVVKPGGTILLKHHPEYAAGAHTMLINLVNGQVSQFSSNGYLYTVIAVI